MGKAVNEAEEMESLTGEGGGSRLAGDFGAGCTTVGLIARASLATQVHDKGRPVTRSRKIESWQPPQACRGSVIHEMQRRSVASMEGRS
jgi:hypothetical protein